MDTISLELKDLEVESFETSALSDEKAKQLKGGGVQRNYPVSKDNPMQCESYDNSRCEYCDTYDLTSCCGATD